MCTLTKLFTDSPPSLPPDLHLSRPPPLPTTHTTLSKYTCLSWCRRVASEGFPLSLLAARHALTLPQIISPPLIHSSSHSFFQAHSLSSHTHAPQNSAPASFLYYYFYLCTFLYFLSSFPAPAHRSIRPRAEPVHSEASSIPPSLPPSCPQVIYVIGKSEFI